MFDTWSRPLWSWILDHLMDPDIVQHIQWDAQNVSMDSKEGPSQIYTEPWTRDHFWRIQVHSIEPILNQHDIYGNESCHYQKMRRCFVLSSMLTRLDFLHLELRKSTQLWHISLTSLWGLGTVRVLVVAIPSDGSQWCVQNLHIISY